MRIKFLALTAALAISAQSAFATAVIRELRNINGAEGSVFTIKGKGLRNATIEAANADRVKFGDPLELTTNTNKTIRANHINVDATRGIIYILTDRDGDETDILASVTNQPAILDGGTATNGDAGQASDNDVALVGADGDSNVDVGGDNTFAGTNNFTGNVTLAGNVTTTGSFQGATPIIFEGNVANDFETTLAVTNPTLDATITVPNKSGTIDLVGATANTITLSALTAYSVLNFGRIANVSHDTNPRTITTLTDGVAGQIIALNSVNADGVNTITISDTDANTANTINLAGAATNFTMNAVGETIILMFNGTKWFEIGRGE